MADGEFFYAAIVCPTRERAAEVAEWIADVSGNADLVPIVLKSVGWVGNDVLVRTLGVLMSEDRAAEAAAQGLRIRGTVSRAKRRQH
jgi:hypothetical protein